MEYYIIYHILWMIKPFACPSMWNFWTYSPFLASILNTKNLLCHANLQHPWVFFSCLASVDDQKITISCTKIIILIKILTKIINRVIEEVSPWNQLDGLQFLMYLREFLDMWYVWYTIQKLSTKRIDWRDYQWSPSQPDSPKYRCLWKKHMGIYNFLSPYDL